MPSPIAEPKYAVGDTVRYVDHHDRLQWGSVLRIEATWGSTHGTHPFISYMLTHPTYHNRRTYKGERDIMRIAT